MLVITGDSHANAIGRAMVRYPLCIPSALRERHDQIVVKTILPGYRFLEDFFLVEEQGVKLLHGAAELLAEATGTDGVIRQGETIYGFSFGLNPTPLLRKKFWAEYTLLPEASDKMFISQAAYREIVLNENKHVLHFARSIRELGVQALFLVAPPLRRAMTERQASIASEFELLEIHRAYQHTMRTALSDIGISCVQPGETTDASGLLQPAFDNRATNDVHHANPEYGKRVWSELSLHLA
jgi:hypothetical protein